MTADTQTTDTADKPYYDSPCGAASAVTEHAANWTCRQLGCPTRLKSPFRVACEITTSDSKPQLAQELMNSDHDQRITFNPRQCGGRPCIRGMRIRVADILEMLAQGVEVKEILADFPDLEPEDINACLHYAAKRSDIPRLAA